MGKRRQFTSEFKLSIIKELETAKLSEVCRKHDLLPATVCGWRKDYNENPKEAFKGHGFVWKDDARTKEYERLIGRLYAENTFLKKVYEKLKQQIVEEKTVET